MAEQQAAPAAEKPAEAAPKKGMPMKTILIMVVVLIIEGLAISGAFMFSGKPAAVHAEGLAKDAAADGLVPVEKLVIADKFQNNRSGKTYLYDTEIWIVVQKRNEDKVDEQLEAMSAQIASDIATIFRRAEPAHLLEPTLATITRQIMASLDDRIGRDAESKSLVQEVLMKKCIQYRVDSY